MNLNVWVWKSSFMIEEVEENKNYELTKQPEFEAQKHLSLDVARDILKHYRDGIIAYSEGVSRYVLEISKLKAHISTEKKLIEKDEATLLVLERQVGYDEKLLHKYNNNFSKKINSIQELNREYKEMLDNAEYLKLDKRKLHELQEILDEIEELEMAVLQHELERVNLLLKLEPKRRVILALEKELKELKLDKVYFESTKLQQIALISNKEKPEDTTVDTEVLES